MGTDNLFFSTSTGALIPTREKTLQRFHGSRSTPPSWAESCPDFHGITEFQVGRDLEDHPVQPFLAKALSRQDDPAESFKWENPPLPWEDYSRGWFFSLWKFSLWYPIRTSPGVIFFFPLFVIFSIWFLIKEKSPCPLQPLWKHWNLGMRLSKPSSQLFLLWQLPSPLIVLLQPVHISLEQQGPDLDTPGTLQLWPAKCWAGWNSEFSISAGSFLAQGARNCDPPRSFN